MISFENLSGIDKAGIVFQIYGESLALTFFTDLPESEIIRIRIRARELHSVTNSVKKAVLEEFYFKMMTNKYQQNRPSSIKLFDFLDDLSNEQIFYLLGKEKPAVMALAIDQIEGSKRSDFLSKLDYEAKNEVIMELGNLKSLPLEMVVNIAQELKKKATFLPEPKEFSRGGGKKIADILNTMSESEANEYLNQLMTDDPETYADVKKYLLTFEDLLSMSEDVAAEFWTNPELDIDILAKALKGTSEEQTTAVVDNLPKKKQAMFTPLEQPLRKQEVEDARKNIVSMATSMVNSEEIKIEDILSGTSDEMVE